MLAELNKVFLIVLCVVGVLYRAQVAETRGPEEAGARRELHPHLSKLKSWEVVHPIRVPRPVSTAPTTGQPSPSLSSSSASAPLQVRFRAFDKDFHADIHDNYNLTADDYAEFDVVGEGDIIPRAAEATSRVGCYHAGTVRSHADDNEDELHILSMDTCSPGGSLTAEVQAHGHMFSMLPLVPGESDAHFVFRVEDMLHTDKADTDPMTCGLKLAGAKKEEEEEAVADEAAPSPGEESGDDPAPTQRIVRILIVNDASQYRRYGARTETQALSVFNHVAAMYASTPFDPKLRIVLAGQVTVKNGRDPWPKTKLGARGTKVQGSDGLLSEFNHWRVRMEGRLPTYDHGILLSQLDFEDNIAGLAGVRTICTLSQSGSVVRLGGSAPRRHAHISAHEIGHSLGYMHDGQTNQCSYTRYIMAPTVAAATSFSQCTLREHSNYLGRRPYCLRSTRASPRRLVEQTGEPLEPVAVLLHSHWTTTVINDEPKPTPVSRQSKNKWIRALHATQRAVSRTVPLQTLLVLMTLVAVSFSVIQQLKFRRELKEARERLAPMSPAVHAGKEEKRA